MDASIFQPDHLTELPFGLAGRVFRSPMPFRPGDEQGLLFQEYLQAGISTVVVVAEAEECFRRTGRDLLAFYSQQGMQVICYPIRDFSVPASKEELGRVLEAVLEKARSGSNVAVHCNAGYGRTGTFLACLARHAFGFDGQRAIDWVREYVPPALENPDQLQYVLNYNPIGDIRGSDGYPHHPC